MNLLKERLYIGIDGNSTVILNKDGSIKQMTGKEWKVYKSEGNEVDHVGCLPFNKSVELKDEN